MTLDLSPERLRLRERVAMFYAYETALLDDGNFHEWLTLFDDDVHYMLPMRELRQGDVPEREANQATFYVYNEDKASLEARVARLDTGLALVESPPSVTQRLITDILITAADDDGIGVRSSFLLHQLRDERNDALFAGHRQDRLRLRADGFTIARRDIALAHYVLPRAISVFF
jgi:3-phenylpropionate/cinnamic acid dioxygenase small subunit